MDKLSEVLSLLKENKLDKTYNRVIADLMDLRETLSVVNEEVNDVILGLLSEGRYEEVNKLTSIPSMSMSIVKELDTLLPLEVVDSSKSVMEQREFMQDDKNQGYNLYTNPEFFKYKKPCKIKIFGNVFEVKSWREACVIFLKYLYNTDSNTFKNLRELDTTQYISRNPSELRRPMLIGGNIYFEGNRSADTIFKLMGSVAEQYSNVFDKSLRENVELFMFR